MSTGGIIDFQGNNKNPREAKNLIIKDYENRLEELEKGGGSSVEVVQTTGQSTTAVMSQKATTDAIEAGGSSVEVVQTTGQSTTAVMSQKATTDAIAAGGGGSSVTVLETDTDIQSWTSSDPLQYTITPEIGQKLINHEKVFVHIPNKGGLFPGRLLELVPDIKINNNGAIVAIESSVWKLIGAWENFVYILDLVSPIYLPVTTTTQFEVNFVDQMNQTPLYTAIPLTRLESNILGQALTLTDYYDPMGQDFNLSPAGGNLSNSQLFAATIYGLETLRLRSYTDTLTSVPTSSTKGILGQIYRYNGELYVCVNYQYGTGYTWVKLNVTSV